MNKEILIIDDNPDIRLLVSNILIEQTILRTAAIMTRQFLKSY